MTTWRTWLGNTIRILLPLLTALSLPGFAQNPLVVTVAGGYIGNGQPATSAAFNSPFLYVTADSKGNLYIADSGDSRVRKIDSKGTVTTIAGTGISGYSGDGGPARSAMVSNPSGIAVDKAGNVFFSDNVNQRVRKIDRNGIITTFAGNGGFGPPGDGGSAVDANVRYPNALLLDSQGNLYISQFDTVRMVDTTGIIHLVAGTYNSFGYGGDGGPATLATLYFPGSIGFDGDSNLYIADTGNHRVRKVDTAGFITTIAGNGGSSCPATGDGGPATSASVPSPSGVAVKEGQLLISDGCSRIRAVDLQTNVIAATAGTGGGCFNGDGLAPLLTEFCGVRALSVDSAGCLLETELSGRIRRITDTVTTIAGAYVGDGGPGRKASLTLGFAGNNLALDGGGNLYIADTLHMRVRKMDKQGIITTFAGTGITGSSGDGGPATSATLSYPSAVAADHNGNLYIADFRIRKIDANGIITTFSTLSSFISDLATDATGNLYAVDQGACAIWKISPAGAASIFAGVQGSCGYNGDGIPATQAYLMPLGVAVDSKGNVYIADWVNNRIRMVDTNGMIATIAGIGNPGYGGDGGPATSAMLFLPQGVSVDKLGNVYIADTGNVRVRIVDPTGKIRTLAGTGREGYNGDRLSATQANLHPMTVTARANGTVFVMDADGYRVRRIH